MNGTAWMLLTPAGIAKSASDKACAQIGATAAAIVGAPLADRLRPEDRPRYESELAALSAGEEEFGRVTCAAMGDDGVLRKIDLRLTRLDTGDLHVDLFAREGAAPLQPTWTTSVVRSNHLLELTRRLAAACRRATTPAELLDAALSMLAEVTSAKSGAALEWAGTRTSHQVAAVYGRFDENLLKGVLRTSVLGRLARGDAVVKDASTDSANSTTTLVLLPLIGPSVPEGIIILEIDGYVVLAPQELQVLGILGDIIGLGLRTLPLDRGPKVEHTSRAADVEGVIALGRFSSSLAHDINNAATVLRNNVEQMTAAGRSYWRSALTDSIASDTLEAVETIRGLTEALRAFAPEETRGLEEVDIRRIVDTVLAAVRFYAKRGSLLTLEVPDGSLPWVRCRSHFLIRSLFLVLVELTEAALLAGDEFGVRISLEARGDSVALIIAAAASSFQVPTVLLSQLVPGGVLARHVSKAGAALSQYVAEGELRLEFVLPVVATPRRSVVPASGLRPMRRGKILIVDDEIAIIRSTRRILEREHDVLAARSGPEAIQVARSNPDLSVILLDVFMPGMSGPQVREELMRLDPALAERVIFISGGVADPSVAEYVDASGCPLLEKPLDIPMMYDLIAGLMQ
jgi:CheY-like chemotaxis protein